MLMPKVEYTAILLGATGNVGGHILHLLVQSPLCKTRARAGQRPRGSAVKILEYKEMESFFAT